MRRACNLFLVVPVYFIASSLTACGGSSNPPPISVSLSQTTATVQAGATADFTATVTNDSSNSGVKWSVSCPKAPCGSVSPTSTPSGVPAKYSAPGIPPANNATVTIVAASVADASKTASASVTFPAILVSASPGTATLQAAATEQLTAIVSYDPNNGGVTWAISCPTAQCGTLSTKSTPSGTATIYTAPATLPSGGATITVTAAALSDTSKSSSVTLIPVGQIAGYDVGVDYHAYGTNIDSTGFIAIYDQPQVRQTVQAQLQGMADRGASSIQTAIWVAKGPSNTCCSTAQVTFPMTSQEQANLRAYAQDVASVVGAAGNRLRLDIALNWLADADFTIGSPTATLGPDNLTPADFASRVQATTDQVFAAVGDLTRPDGVKLVDTIFFASEPNIPAPGEVSGTPNIGWFLTTNYPHFVSTATQAGIRPSIYFIGCGPQDVVLDNSYVDSSYAILNGHRSMFWVYRGLKFLVDNGLPLPSGRADFDCYFDSSGATYAQLLQRILDDADATLPSLGAPKVYNIPETYYLADPALRLQYGQAFATQAAQSPRLQRVSFWTTPGGGPNMEEQNSAYPFTIEDFLPIP